MSSWLQMNSFSPSWSREKSIKKLWGKIFTWPQISKQYTTTQGVSIFTYVQVPHFHVQIMVSQFQICIYFAKKCEFICLRGKLEMRNLQICENRNTLLLQPAAVVVLSVVMKKPFWQQSKLETDYVQKHTIIAFRGRFKKIDSSFRTVTDTT